MKNYKLLLLIAGLVTGCIISTSGYAGQVGEIKYARGAVTLQKTDGKGARLVGKGDVIQQGEVIKTGSKSYAIINLADETRMTLRPDTSFAVESMNAEKSINASALLRLFKGGFRAITGFISKKNPRGYKVKTTVATIGIRGTEFDARLCQNECGEENKKLEQKLKDKQEKVVARVVYKRGKLDAYDFADTHRLLETKSDIFVGDKLSTGENSYSIVIFKDKSRISLQANTDFRIDELNYKKNERTGVSALFSLLRGGLRTATGLIGKLAPTKYRMRTRIATIGIRGTGYDLLCTGTCSDEDSGKYKLPDGDGLYANVWEGSIAVDDVLVNTGQSAYVKDSSTDARILSEIPDVFKNNPVPRPDDKQFEDFDFSPFTSQTIEPGLYVSVTDGVVSINPDNTDEEISLTKGEAGYANNTGEEVTKLPAIPAFQELDQYPTPDNYQSQIPGLNTTTIGGNQNNNGVICEIK